MTAPLPPRLSAFSAAQRLSFDSLRGLIALLLVVQHMGQCGFSVVPQAYTHQRFVSVAIFFTLSGFLITRSVLRPAVFVPPDFLRGRVRRIFPPYLICLLFMVVMVEPGFLLHDPAGVTLGNVAAHVTLTYAWFAHYADAIVPPLWTLSHEWSFYLLMAGSAFLLRRRYGWWLPVGMIVGALFCRLGVNKGTLVLANGMRHGFCIMDLFAFGMIAGALSRKEGVVRQMQRGVVVGPLLVVATALVGWALHRHYSVALLMEGDYAEHWRFHAEFSKLFLDQRSSVLWYQPALAAGTAIFLLVLWLRPRFCASWLRYTPLPWMGKVSYSTYLWHWAIIVSFMRAMRRTPEDSVWQHSWASFFLLLAAIYALSAVTWYFFERPFMKVPEPRRAAEG